MTDLKRLGEALNEPKPNLGDIFRAMTGFTRADHDEMTQSYSIMAERSAYELRLAVDDLTVQFALEAGKGWVKASQEDIASSYRQLGVLVRAMERD